MHSPVEKVPVAERARRYLRKLPGAVSGSGGHAATFHAACVLVHGFDLAEGEALALLQAEFNPLCAPPWSEAELIHKVRGAAKARSDKPRGYMLQASGVAGRDRSLGAPLATVAPAPKPEFDVATLKRVAGDLAGQIDLPWLANRSAIDPATLYPADFLAALYGPGEKIVCFTQQMSQGQAVWPEERVPVRGADGVWYLAQPVDGVAYPNPRSLDKQGQPKLSRRSEESVRAFRYLVLESDEAPAELWLAALVRMPLRIEAIYSSGGRSLHALVRVDARTKGEWDAEKRAMAPGLAMLGLCGADPAAMTAVRLTRLPNAMRGDRLQRLYYVRKGAPLSPLLELPVVRDVVKHWGAMAAAGISDADETDWPKRLKSALRFYAPLVPELGEKLRGLEAYE